MSKPGSLAVILTLRGCAHSAFVSYRCALPCALWQISRSVHGPLLELLARECGYHDYICVEIFRRGGCIVGRLERCECVARAHVACCPQVLGQATVALLKSTM